MIELLYVQKKKLTRRIKNDSTWQLCRGYGFVVTRMQRKPASRAYEKNKLFRKTLDKKGLNLTDEEYYGSAFLLYG